jgi:hypothetical protein
MRAARIVDLSATGARIDGLEAPAGTRLRVAFVDPVTTLRVQKTATVMRSAVGDTGAWVGIAFVDEPPAARAA